MFIIDASVALSWCFPDEHNPYADAVLDNLKNSGAIVPVLWVQEIVNIMCLASKKNRVTESERIFYFSMLSHLPIHIAHVAFDKDRLFSLCATYNLTSYDASYIYLAIEQNLPIATLDKGMQTALERLGIQLYQPTAIAWS